MPEIELIILSKTDSNEIFKMNNNCINSFIKSAEKANVTYEIILVESNFEANYNYNNNSINIIKPNLPFNFHQFGNIGIKKAKGEYFVFSNNDVLFNENWLVELLKVSENNKTIASFSPYDNLSNKVPKVVIQSNSFLLGYEIQKHLTGWCIVMRKSVFESIKSLDERFLFYYADNDYAMQLQQNNIKHALVTKAIVNHLEKKNIEKLLEKFELPKNTPQYIIKENWTWVLQNKKMIEGLIVFHQKWGSRKELKLKLYIIKILRIFNLGVFNKYILKSN